jgi:DNA-binding transcriptional LysR family regulator
MTVVFNDLALLALVIESGGFTRASRVSGITTSKLSRRISELERQLGVQLIDRNSRHFSVTAVGMDLYRHGAAIRTEGQAALDLAQETLSEPRGPLRVACPIVLAQLVVGEISARFAQRYPAVQLTVDVTDGTLTMQLDRHDIVLCAALSGLPSSDVIARQIMLTPYEVVASPEWLDTTAPLKKPQDLANLDAIGWWDSAHAPRWTLSGADGATIDVPIHPRFVTNNLIVARSAALSGLGMARLPRPLCVADLTSGSLRRVLPEWSPAPMAIFAVYPSRRSLTVTGRSFLDRLNEGLAAWLAGLGEPTLPARNAD